jgi:hypothetical protein
MTESLIRDTAAPRYDGQHRLRFSFLGPYPDEPPAARNLGRYKRDQPLRRAHAASRSSFWWCT